MSDAYETFERLLREHKVTPYRVSKATGITTATLTSWKQGKYTPKQDKLQKIADYFGVGIEVFVGSQTSNSPIPTWATKKDERDFKKLLEEDTEIMFDGVPLTQEDKQRVMDVLTGLFWEAKQMNKRKKNPSDDK
ncbi:helix-turn-helix domain-containing protein [Cohnella thailandensis]|uniref:Helix-turn-helix transcriptional regulator n=1 Tax=Cohnella thailandensis TaxID=557557 RepID=A0A841SQB6_9BACL|nr:helix-turn-helix transcriptional regulator [Cohnella thailandensis]MBB6632796.1 helix-turn-helix transcriptional regulator [Cohnella thailandensis]MBP1975512.1 transcriptional regulator with XRE-family HTH domain [Cohnella thailandensis]